LPFHNQLTDDDLRRVCEVVRVFHCGTAVV
jgi:hypothetical protein